MSGRKRSGADLKGERFSFEPMPQGGLIFPVASATIPGRRSVQAALASLTAIEAHHRAGHDETGGTEWTAPKPGDQAFLDQVEDGAKVVLPQVLAARDGSSGPTDQMNIPKWAVRVEAGPSVQDVQRGQPVQDGRAKALALRIVDAGLAVREGDETFAGRARSLLPRGRRKIEIRRVGDIFERGRHRVGRVKGDIVNGQGERETGGLPERDLAVDGVD